MPDSERDRQDANEEGVAAQERKKVAKKPAKKATKKAVAKKVAAPEPEVTPEPEQTAIDRVGETLDQVIAQARAEGIPALVGSATVRLIMTVEGAATPGDAVDRFVRTLANQGLMRWSYVVTDDETGENYMVNDGEIVRIEGDMGGAG